MDGWSVLEAWGGGFGRARRVGSKDTEAGGLSINSRFGIVDGGAEGDTVSSSGLGVVVLGLMIGSTRVG